MSQILNLNLCCWLPRSQVVFMHPDGPDAVGCAHCVTSWSGKINTYDRPDVVPGQTAQSSGSDIFAVKVHYTLPDLIVYCHAT